MKSVKKIILFSTISIIFFCSFLMPVANAQEWVYDGANTERIPNHSVYPSECYVFKFEIPGFPTDSLGEIEVTHGNITNYMMMGNGTCVWANAYTVNITSGEKTLDDTNILISYWNETIGYISETTPIPIIPVENDGKVSAPILGFVSVYLGMTLADLNLEYVSIYENIYSIAFWNETLNDAYMYFNWTDDGILKKMEANFMGNFSLYSQPAQLPPVFGFTTEHDTLNVDSTDTDLKVVITDADNNNDGVNDRDYLYRIFYNSTWTSWAPIPPLIDFDLGSVPAGNYTVSCEVKNMYGVTQEQIEIQYEPPEEGKTPKIPGYSIILISIALLIGVSFMINKNRKKI